MKDENKYKKLALSILLDGIGMLSYSVFGAAETIDLVWAPASALIMAKMYKGNTGKIAAAVTFIEEALPFTDVMPTFTLMWLYTYVFKTKESNVEKDEKTIDI